MSDVDRQFEAFKAAYARDGDTDPAPFLDAVSGTDRVELGGLIDGFLARAPRQGWDAQAFAASPVAAVAARLEDELFAGSLAELRERSGLSQKALAKKLARALGVRRKRDKVGRYYGQLEDGDLSVAGVSPRVFEALAEIFGANAGAIRRAAEPPRPEPAGGRAVFAAAAAAQPAAPPPGGPRAEPWDEVDELFRGG